MNAFYVFNAIFYGGLYLLYTEMRIGLEQTQLRGLYSFFFIIILFGFIFTIIGYYYFKEEIETKKRYRGNREIEESLYKRDLEMINHKKKNTEEAIVIPKVRRITKDLKKPKAVIDSFEIDVFCDGAKSIFRDEILYGMDESDVLRTVDKFIGWTMSQLSSFEKNDIKGVRDFLAQPSKAVEKFTMLNDLRR